MPSDRAISATRFDGGTVVQAFPLGGRVRNVPLSAEVPQPLSLVSTPPSDIIEISPKTSVIMLRVPPGRTLYVGNAAQMAPHIAAEGPPEALRTVMFPLPGGVYVFSIVEDELDQVVVMSDGAVGFNLMVLEAATLGPEG